MHLWHWLSWWTKLLKPLPSKLKSCILKSQPAGWFFLFHDGRHLSGWRPSENAALCYSEGKNKVIQGKAGYV